jgi:hypothetical protein
MKISRELGIDLGFRQTQLILKIYFSWRSSDFYHFEIAYYIL